MMDGIYEIMCYGDSNTWGTVARPHKDAPHPRYGRDVRWPCVLQKLLGDGCAVREEGLGGRTTIYTANPAMPFKNGLHMLEGCLKTHAPLDLVILMLGTNDLHQPEPLPEAEMGHGIATLVELIQAHPEYGPEEKRPPEILLIAPPFITPSAPDARTEVYGQFFGEYGERLSRRFPEVCGSEEVWRRLSWLPPPFPGSRRLFRNLLSPATPRRSVSAWRYSVPH